MAHIFHITSDARWQQASVIGWYEPSGFRTEHFIHCSYKHQIVGVANRWFRGQSHLILLEIVTEQLSCPVVAENLEGEEELFPHIYGRLALTAVTTVHPFSPNEQGQFELPTAINRARTSQ